MTNKIKKRHYKYLHHLFAISLITLITFSTTVTFAQNRINSPYSMIGPGEFKGNELFANISMGGIAQGFRNRQTVNFINPASYTVTDSLSFIFDASIFYHLYEQTTTTAPENQMSSYSSPGNLTFSFPVTRWWSVAAGLLPFTQVGYKISDASADDVNGTTNFFYEGNGGINHVFVGNAFEVAKGVSVGINVGYLFGKSQNSMTSSSDSVGFYRTQWNNTDNYDGLLLTYGLQWQIPFSETSSLTLGASYTGSTDLQLSQNQSVLRNLPGVSFTSDTLSFVQGDNQTTTIPDGFGAGLFMQFNPQWGVGFDYETKNWSNYSKAGENPGLNNTQQIRLGAVLNPRVETYTGFLNRLEYRMGARYGNSFLNLQNSGFNEFGIGFGFSIPVRRSLSAINLGFEYSRRIPANNDLIEENFFRFNFGINVNERWFVKRKFF